MDWTLYKCEQYFLSWSLFIFNSDIDYNSNSRQSLLLHAKNVLMMVTTKSLSLSNSPPSQEIIREKDESFLKVFRLNQTKDKTTKYRETNLCTGCHNVDDFKEILITFSF